MAVISNTAILEYVASVGREFEKGTLPTFPNPDPPASLGSALTQDDIDSLKIFLKEITERFAGGGA